METFVKAVNLIVDLAIFTVMLVIAQLLAGALFGSVLSAVAIKWIMLAVLLALVHLHKPTSVAYRAMVDYCAAAVLTVFFVMTGRWKNLTGVQSIKPVAE